MHCDQQFHAKEFLHNFQSNYLLSFENLITGCDKNKIQKDGFEHFETYLFHSRTWAAC